MAANVAQDYFRETVKPTVDEFLHDPFCVRRARLAAIVLYHLADYLKAQANQDWGVTKIAEAIAVKCPDFLLVRDVCDASKHCVLTNESRGSKSPRRLEHSDQLDATSHEGLFSAPFGSGFFAEASYVWIKLDDGSWRNFVDVVSNVISFFDVFDFDEVQALS